MDGSSHAVAPGMRMQIVMSSAMSNQQVASKAREFMEENNK